MAEMTIPPWLTRDYDPVGTFVKSYQIGANISMEQSRLAEQQRQANMEAEYKREQMAANIIKAQQDLAVEQAKTNQEVEFKQQQLNAAKEKAAQAAMISMAKMNQDAAYRNAMIGLGEGRLSEQEQHNRALEGFREREVAVKEKPTVLPELEAKDVPGLPGFKAVPSPTGKGYNLQRVPTDKAITPSTAASILKSIPELESIDPSITNAVPSLINIIRQSLPAQKVASTNEIIRIAPNGRRVVYDAATKKPIRYAD